MSAPQSTAGGDADRRLLLSNPTIAGHYSTLARTVFGNISSHTDEHQCVQNLLCHWQAFTCSARWCLGASTPIGSSDIKPYEENTDDIEDDPTMIQSNITDTARLVKAFERHSQIRVIHLAALLVYPPGRARIRSSTSTVSGQTLSSRQHVRHQQTCLRQHRWRLWNPRELQRCDGAVVYEEGPVKLRRPTRGSST